MTPTPGYEQEQETVQSATDTLRENPVEEARHHHSSKQANPSAPQRHAAAARGCFHIACGLLVLVVSYAGFSFRHYQEVPFADEYSYLVQTFYLDLFETRPVGQPRLEQLPRHRPATRSRNTWVPWPSKPADARPWETSPWPKPGITTSTSPSAPIDDLMAARRANPIMGALGCLAVYGIGLMLRGPCTGLLAAALLAH